MKKLEDYIHLYIGAKCTIHQLGEKPGSTGVIIGVHLDDAFTSNPWVIVRDADRSERSIRLYEINLILRPLSDLTSKEQDELWHADEPLGVISMYNGDNNRKIVLAPDRVAYLLSKGFDLFGLIPAGLAQKREG